MNKEILKIIGKYLLPLTLHFMALLCILDYFNVINLSWYLIIVVSLLVTLILEIVLTIIAKRMINKGGKGAE